MIDDGMGFQLVPWRPALEQRLGHEVSGVVALGGAVNWNFGRKPGIGMQLTPGRDWAVCGHSWRRLSGRCPPKAGIPESERRDLHKSTVSY